MVCCRTCLWCACASNAGAGSGGVDRRILVVCVCVCVCLWQAGKTGLMACVNNLLSPIEEWTCGGVPIASMMNIERRKGKDKPVWRAVHS